MGKTINAYATANPGDVVPAVGTDRVPGDRGGAPKVLTLSGLLNNPGFTGYTDYSEIAQPANPGANVVRLFAEDNFGLTTLQYVNSSGQEVRLAQDNLTIVRNTTGSTLLKGKAVYITGATGNRPTVALARANAAGTMPAIGLVFADIGNNSDGFVMKLGRLTNLDTSAFTEGNILYVSSAVAGELVNSAPASPNLVQSVGIVATSNAGNGRIAVDIDNIVSVPGGSNTQLQFNNNGAFGGIANATWNGTTLALTAPVTLAGAVGQKALTITGATQTTSQPLLDLAQTWNNGATTFTALKLNVTNTASGASSLLQDWQVGGVSKAQITTVGSGVFDGGFVYFTTSLNSYIRYAFPGFIMQFNGNRMLAGDQSAVKLPNSLAFGWSSDTTAGLNQSSIPDVALRRGAADVLRQIRSTNAQTFELYNTTNSDTSPVDYERGFMRWATNVLEIGNEKGGTGTARQVDLWTQNGNKFQFKAGSAAQVELNFAAATGYLEVQGTRIARMSSTFLAPGADGTKDLGTSTIYWQNFYLKDYINWKAALTTDTAPNDDTTAKKLSIQRRAAAPTNAAYIKFSNSPGTPTNDFYLVLEEG